MKIKRTTKLSIKYATNKKLDAIDTLLIEFARVVNFYIDRFKEDTPEPSQLLKPIVDVCLTDLEGSTWLSYTLRQTAARDAISMLRGMKTRQENNPKARVSLPVHNGKKIILNSLCVKLIKTGAKGTWDYWLKLTALGTPVDHRSLKIWIPLKSHKHLKHLLAKGTLANSITLTRDTITVCIDIETGPKRSEGDVIGLDSGFAKDGALAVLSNGDMYGLEISRLINKIDRKKRGSKKQKRARKELKNYIARVAKEVTSLEMKMLVVENLKNMTKKPNTSKTKKAPRLGAKNMRRRIGIWSYRHWLGALKMACELNCVQFRSVSPYNTSVTCPNCGHIDPKNRAQRDVFKCVKCGHSAHADINAALNILARGLRGEELRKEQNSIQSSDRKPLTNLELNKQMVC